MAGLNLIFSFDGIVSDHQSSYQSALDATISEQTHRVEGLFEDDYIRMSFSGYEGYPVRSFESDGVKYYVEGKFFNLDQKAVDDAIVSFSNRFFKGDQSAKKDIKDWLLTVDGEFLILTYNPAERRILIFNDVFGHLPCYMYKTDWGVVFSRNFLFVSEMVDLKQLDRMALAQFLTLRYTIADRTFLQDVCSIKPAHLVSIETDARTLNKEVLHVFNFEKKKYRHRSAKKNAIEAAKLFTEGCRRRAEHEGKNVVSLSGGLDSRAVISAFTKAGVDFESLTFLDKNKTADNDFNLAQKVTEALGVPISKIELDTMNGRNMLRTLKMKGGFVYLGKVLLLQFFDKVLADYGHKAVLYTGLGGDKVARDTRKKGLFNLDQLIARLVKNECVMPLDSSLKLIGVSKEGFYQELKKEISNYPERSISQKSIHLGFYMRNIKWHFEGTDRQRNFFWPGSPFFAIDFFHYIMNCPDRQKKYLRFYAHFLENLNQETSILPYAVNNSLTPVSITNCRSILWYFKCSMLRACRAIPKWPNPVRFAIKKIKKTLYSEPAPTERKFDHTETLLECIKEQVSICSKEGDFMNWSEILDVIDNSEKYNNESIYILLSVVSITELLTTGRSSLERYQDSDFGSFDSNRRSVDPTLIS